MRFGRRTGACAGAAARPAARRGGGGSAGVRGSGRSVPAAARWRDPSRPGTGNAGRGRTCAAIQVTPARRRAASGAADAVDAHPVAFARDLQRVEPGAVAFQQRRLPGRPGCRTARCARRARRARRACRRVHRAPRRGCWRRRPDSARRARSSGQEHVESRRRRRCARRCRAWRAAPADRCRRRPHARRRASAPPARGCRSRNRSRARVAPRSRPSLGERIQPLQAQRGGRMRAGAERQARIQPHHRRVRRIGAFGQVWFHGTIQVRAPNCSGTYWSIHARSQSWSSTVAERRAATSPAPDRTLPARPAAAARRRRSGTAPTARCRPTAASRRRRVRGSRARSGCRLRRRAASPRARRRLPARVRSAAGPASRQRRDSSRKGIRCSHALLRVAFDDPVLAAPQHAHAAVQVVQAEQQRQRDRQQVPAALQHRPRIRMHQPPRRTPGRRPPAASASGC